MVGFGGARRADGLIFICIGNGNFMETSAVPKRYLNVDEVAAYLGFSKNTIYKLVETRNIPFIKPGGLDSLRFDIKAIDKWMEKQTVPAKRLLASPVA